MIDDKRDPMLPVNNLLILLQNEDETEKIRLSLPVNDNNDYSPVTGQELQTTLLHHINNNHVAIEIYHNEYHTFVPLHSILTDIRAPPFGTRLRCIVVHPQTTTTTTTTTPPQLLGRYYDTTNIQINGKLLHIQEQPNGTIGTGLTIWDGAILLTKVLEQIPSMIQGKNVLEFGSGVGLVGIAAACLGANHVIMTDLPYALPLMKANVQRNIHHYQHQQLKQQPKRQILGIDCQPCDWFHPTHLMQWSADVVLLADCVWIQELVPPLLQTLEMFVAQHESVMMIVSYQQRGKAAHTMFWEGMNQLFSRIVELDITSMGLSKPHVLHVYKCQN